MRTVRQAAEDLGISKSLMYDLCARRLIRHERIGLGRGTIRIPLDAIQEYRGRRTVGVAEPSPTPVVRKKIKLRHLDV